MVEVRANESGRKPTFLFGLLVMPVVGKEELLQAVAALSEQAAEGTGVEIVDVDLRGSGKARLLRVYIDKPGGVSHDDCETISRRLGAELDEKDVIPDEGYTLEVSSPGVDRPLKKLRDFERVVGQSIKLSLHEPISGNKRLEGKLLRVTGDALFLEASDDPEIRIELDQVQKANLKFDW